MCTFTAGVPLVARHSRHQDSSHGPDKLNQWTPSTYPNHLQKRIQPPRYPNPWQTLPRPVSPNFRNLDNAVHEFLTKVPPGSTSHPASGTHLSRRREAYILCEIRYRASPEKSQVAQQNKVRESWDKLLQNVQKWFSSWFSTSQLHNRSNPFPLSSLYMSLLSLVLHRIGLSKKTQSDENAAKSLTTTGTPPDHAASQIQTASTTHQTSEYEHAKPQAQNSDVKMAETAQTVTTHESSSLPILRFDFTRLYADPCRDDDQNRRWFLSSRALVQIGFLIDVVLVAPTILSDNHSSSGLPKSVSLPNLSRQNPDEINDAAWLQTVSQMQHATYSVAEQESLHAFAPSTHEGQLVQALLQQVDTLELAQCIHQVFRRSGIKLYMLSQLLSINTIRDILIAYGATVGQKMEGMLVKQQISSTILGYLTSFIRDWPPALEPEKEPGIKTLPPNE
ncbi:hypothetical protein PSHT_02089 [Puccinia striiformis]|uniref:Uncharacterized protein n=1 Tax=Puccinia striiformis TaxID=27350 RepID=A0A2S4WIU5_9BASI|nr:hypothetical protein PSHT_02089 [Puccinia striiformis]